MDELLRLRDVSAPDPYYHSQNILIVNPYHYNPPLAGFIGLTRVEGPFLSENSEECSISTRLPRVQGDGSTENLCSIHVLSDNRTGSDRCIFYLTWCKLTQLIHLALQPLDNCHVFVNGDLLDPRTKRPLNYGDYVEIRELASGKRWVFQYCVTALFHDQTRREPYTLIRKLGTGGQGSVYECEEPVTKQRVAIKITRRAGHRRTNYLPSFDALRELFMLHLLWEPRSVQEYRRAFPLKGPLARFSSAMPSIPFISSSGGWFAWGYDHVVLPLAVGDLKQWVLSTISSTGRPPNDPQVCNVAIQVFDALRYLHRKGLVHNDIKPDNILVMDNTFYPHVVVSDLGLCTNTWELQALIKQTQDALGTRMYRPPEATKSVTRPYPISSQKADIWAAGLSLYFTMTGRNLLPKRETTVPLEHYTDQTFTQHWKTLRKAHVPERAISFIKRCLDLDAEKRMSAMHAFKLTWFKQFEPIEPQDQASIPLAFSSAEVVVQPLPETEEGRQIVVPVKRPHSERTPSIVVDGKGKAPARKRREIAA
ncbi:unnamed protein product [Peniophora sp. CBMAI 1063]|nr:unnamed protein product [Peniophora sp. CBMAI 1063]